MLDAVGAFAGPAGVDGLAAATAAVLFAGFLRGFVGFGAALIVVPILSLIYTPAAAVAIACLSGLPTVLQMLPTAIRYAERAFVLPLGLAAFVMGPIGTWVLANAAPALLKVFIAVAVLAMAAFLQSGWRISGRPRRTLLLAVGGVSGLIQGVAGMGGPPTVALALARSGDARAQRGNVIAAVTALALSTVLPLWRLGLFTDEVLRLSLVFVPAHTIAAWFGARHFDRSGHGYYRQAALLTLIAVGLFTLAVAIRDAMLR